MARHKLAGRLAWLFGLGVPALMFLLSRYGHEKLAQALLIPAIPITWFMAVIVKATNTNICDGFDCIGVAIILLGFALVITYAIIGYILGRLLE